MEFLRMAVAAYRQLDDTWHLAEALSWLTDALDGVGQGLDATAARVEAWRLLEGFDDTRSVELRARVSPR